MHVEVQFPVRGEKLPTDHAYLLYAALSRAVPVFHDREAGVRFAPINGERGGKGEIRLFERSVLRMRMPVGQIPAVVRLAGRKLEIGPHRVRLLIPRVFPLRPAPALGAKLVTFKHSLTPEAFLTTARQKLNEAGIRGTPSIPLVESGDFREQPRRRVVRIKGRRIVGFALRVGDLTAEESLRLQEQGLGGRSRIGCGFFVPIQAREGRG
jgi:CRISPR-associated protein Cas6